MSQSGKLVMAMQDEDDIALLVAHHLEPNGFRTHRPLRPFHLVSDAEKERPALVLLDLMLPESDGFQLCRSIRRHPGLRDVPILVLTASVAAHDRERAMECGADGYNTRPFMPSAVDYGSENDNGSENAGSARLSRRTVTVAYAINPFDEPVNGEASRAERREATPIR